MRVSKSWTELSMHRHTDTQTDTHTHTRRQTDRHTHTHTPHPLHYPDLCFMAVRVTGHTFVLRVGPFKTDFSCFLSPPPHLFSE